ncbi:O-antigen ligase family protein [Streptomyces himalayensis]|uniref:O-antigen ligase family protein n=1 Tax=Streptomyces himalayensis subsp. himalayensis TaxID=2756131 RepID=A0A7W0DIX5_9ACTN|nr:O-antigen ligase family protein [Streptomyces himalayensis]MBA2945957.1 O-antigen ligase family protein [Streptomyces himalayensis subsp. himalayensis]
MATAGGPPGMRELRSISDAAGIVVLSACAVWSLITAASRQGRPEGVLLAVLAVGAGYACGRITGALLPVGAPCVGALAGLLFAATSPPAAPGPDMASPLGDAGATAALLALSTGAACCAAWAAEQAALRLALRLLAAGIVVAAATLGSTAGFVTCVGVLLYSLAAARMRRRGLALAGLGGATALVTGLSWAVTEDVLPDGLTISLEGQLTEHRILLWRDALDLAGQEPFLGVGPGRFGELSPTVAQTLVADGRPHSAPLQQAAEQGIVGVSLLAAVFCWILYALWRSPRATPVAVTAGAALTSLALMALVGNTLSFTTVTAGGGLLAGFATSRPWGDDLGHGFTGAQERSESGTFTEGR